ncbi:MAG: PIN-like domain-containing protein [Sedimenticola sp.]
MKNVFSGFYNPSDQSLKTAWKSETTLFVFDTSTLINLYGYATQTRDDFFSILEKIEDNIWIPYHVGIEYQKRRLGAVKEEKAVFSKINACIKSINSVFDDDFKELNLNRRFPALHTKTEKLQSDINKHISKYNRSVSTLDKKQPCVRGHDSIRETIDTFFNDKVGNIPENQKWLDDIYSEGEERYKIKVPPGYMDTNKGKAKTPQFVYSGLLYERKYGDFIIWKQIMEKAENENIKAVIFITDDAKEDWWYKLDSRGDKIIGPRAELREEICKNSKIDIFTIYNTSDFLSAGKDLLNVNISNDSVSDAETTFKFNISNIAMEKYQHLFQDDSDDVMKFYKDTTLLNQFKKQYDLLEKYDLKSTIDKISRVGEITSLDDKLRL